MRLETTYPDTVIDAETFKEAASFVGSFDWGVTYVPDMCINTYTEINFRWATPHVSLSLTVGGDGEYAFVATFPDGKEITDYGSPIGEPLPDKVLDALKKPQETKKQ